MIYEPMQRNFVVSFTTIHGEKKEVVRCISRTQIRPILQKKYGLGVKIREVHKDE